MAEVKTESKITAPKLLVFIGMLYTIALGITYFYAVNPFTAIYVLWGILCLVIAFLIFLTLDLISFGPLKIPYQWWIILIFGIILVIFGFFFGGGYFPAILLIVAALIEIIMEKKPYKASKLVLLVGIGFSIYDCFVLFLSGNALFIVNGVFGLILLVLLIIVLFDLVDLKVIKYTWWVVLLIGFVIFTWVSPNAGGLLAGNGGTLILIAFVLMVLAL
jgi:hypothetical protein